MGKMEARSEASKGVPLKESKISRGLVSPGQQLLKKYFLARKSTGNPPANAEARCRRGGVLPGCFTKILSNLLFLVIC